LRPWEALAALLWEGERTDEALQVTSRALNDVAGAESSDQLALIQGRALEGLGEREEAAEAFRIAAQADRGCIEAALSRARLLRALGDWRGAADSLSDFTDAYEGGDTQALSEVLQQQGRLLAGPLEDADSAISVYRRAIELDPDRIEMRASLAEFLSHRPDDWDEALAHFQWVLHAEPTHSAALRVLMRLANERGNPQAIATGGGILRALGIASPADANDAAEAAAPCYSGEPVLADPLWEKLRKLTHEAATEIASALDVSETAPADDHSDPIVAFFAASTAAEVGLSAPGLLPLTDRELGELIQLVAALTIDPDDVQGDGRLVNVMSGALKRRARRRLRRLLEGETTAAIAEVDFSAWRNDLRALAAAIAIDDTDVELRVALLAVACDSLDRSVSDIAPGADVTSLVAASPQACALLRRAVATWMESL
jgi:tetratricopeptide (TPR) repeat protein